MHVLGNSDGRVLQSTRQSVNSVIPPTLQSSTGRCMCAHTIATVYISQIFGDLLK